MITGYATSYGDRIDMLMYRDALAKFLKMGYSQADAERKARAIGDPGVGWVDNDLSDLKTLWVAVPPDYWKAKFGTKAKAHKKKVRVNCLVRGKWKSFTGILGDTMPALKNIKNGAVIDLAPGAQAAIGLVPPFKIKAQWEWV